MESGFKSCPLANLLAKIKTMKKLKLVEKYTEAMLLDEKPPKNVYSFAKKCGIEESDFYEHFASFDAIKQWVFVKFFEDTMELQLKSEDYKSFNDQEKLLSFYYTYFEVLTSNRSLVIELLSSKNPLTNMAVLKPLKSEFQKMVKLVDFPKIDLPVEQLDSIQDKGFSEVLWGQFLTILKYWMEDNSAGFSKTDEFIEKSTSLGFDLMSNTPFDKVVDLGKFLFHDKMKGFFK